MPRGALLALVLGLAACTSDDLRGADSASSTGPESTSSSSSSTGEPTTTGSSSSSGSSSGSSSTGAPPADTTCDEFLQCLGPCALNFDLQCILDCADGLPPDEAAKVGQLIGCVGLGCFESGACTPETLQDPLCLACLGLGLLNPNPPGCEAEADACM